MSPDLLCPVAVRYLWERSLAAR